MAAAAENQMMAGRTPPFYSPLHSMAWAGAFGAATGAGSGGASSPTPPSHKSSTSSYPSFGYPPTPPKESPGGAGTPASLHGDAGGYHGEAVPGAEDVSGDRVEMKPSADHLMQSMALSGYPVTARSHKCQEGKRRSQ